MPCFSVNFQPNIGQLINVIFTQPNVLRTLIGASRSSANPPPATGCPLLIDTGADITCISPHVSQRLQLSPTGKVPVSVPTGQGSTNTYLVDMGIPFGDPAAGGQTFVLENIPVMEYLGNHPGYMGLM